MIGGVQHDMSQDVHNGAGPLLALAVLVRDGLRNVPGGDQIQEFKPLATEFGRLRLALRQVGFGPDRHALGFLPQPLQPDQLGGENVGHQLQRSMIVAAGIVAAGGSNCVQNFPVRPFVVGKLTAQIVGKIHETALRSMVSKPNVIRGSPTGNVVTILSHFRTKLLDVAPGSPAFVTFLAMPRKAPTTRAVQEDEAEARPARLGEPRLGGPDDLARLALRACLIARDAAFNVRDLLTHSSRMAFLAIKDCEKELDQIERQIDEQLPAAITRVNEARARQLLSSLKSTTDLERIGDLVMSVAMRMQARTTKMPAADVRQLVEMSAVLREMLDLIHKGYSTLDLECARKVLQMDKEIDRVCHALFQTHLAENVSPGDTSGFEILLMAQALERAGDHTTNLAEDLYSLIEGRSLRHVPKKKAAN